ncbi:unnamed protein product [Citrullus colocynthis]|uniref:Uncharacterized protein n=1 Tax=Citrullus colocynthis TaxID=252529 RepID=A0ABP0YBQ6_9ROSI
MKFGPISFCSRSYCDVEDDKKLCLRFSQLDVHVKKICYCQNQRSLRPVCSVFCTKSFFRNHRLNPIPELENFEENSKSGQQGLWMRMHWGPY